MKKSVLFIFLLLSNILLIAQEYDIAGFEGKCLRAGFPHSKIYPAVTIDALQDYDVKYYHLDLEADNTSTFIKGSTEIGAVSNVASLGSFVVELITDLTVDSVLTGSTSLSFIHSNDLITVNMGYPVPAGEFFRVKIFYHGTVPEEGFFSGMTSDIDNDWGNSVTWTLSEPFNAKDWFPCKQDLQDKADSVMIDITVPDSLMAGSNGRLINTVPVEGGKTRYEWRSYYPTDYYLISMTVADYQDYSIYAHPAGLDDSILIQNFIYDNTAYLEQNRELIDETATLIELFSDLYSLYPFANEKYGHCVAPMGGAMEHQTMTTIDNFSFYLVAHELGHQWFGDNVTCATWQDIWINEGFASYTEYLAYQNLRSQTYAGDWMDNSHNWAMGLPDGSVYIPFDEASDVSRIFSYALSYKKGAAIIHMIRFELDNDSLFFTTLREFQQEFADSVATGDDFRGVLEDISGRDFSWFFDQWYYGSGFPRFGIEWSRDGDTVSIRSTITTSSNNTPSFKTSVEFRLNYQGGDTTIRVFQEQSIQTFNMYVPYDITSLEVDPANWILNHVSSISYIPEYKEFEERNIRVFPNPFSTSLNVIFPGQPGLKEISLLDISGKELIKIVSEHNEFTLDGSHLPAGLYFLRIRKDDKSYVKKIVKF
ncbi:MAG: T9SS type A sorting domain-containing protein [Bacteroidetes bacterium]|nr:T9SS type A sorting domain-containing protein [Bacteroidota bacterium]